ncbi:MAG: hypothetical protein CMJ64_12645 [Planctomycetaceae bacterium]|nr:hypothetical protein [Planctomycetaceae bacterium]
MNQADRLLDRYTLPESLAFGEVFAPVMYRADHCDGEWGEGGVIPFGDVLVNPASTAVQFGQQAFEGMKSYKLDGRSPTLFRPDCNFRRFARSARRLSMPSVPAELFAAALSELTTLLERFIPGGSGQSLYLRPTLFGLDSHFAVKNSERFAFFVLASPSDAYYAKPIRVMIERNACRAAVGGTGDCKVGGNYGASMQANEDCMSRGFDLPLWLDPDSAPTSRSCRP